MSQGLRPLAFLYIENHAIVAWFIFSQHFPSGAAYEASGRGRGIQGGWGGPLQHRAPAPLRRFGHGNERNKIGSTKKLYYRLSFQTLSLSPLGKSGEGQAQSCDARVPLPGPTLRAKRRGWWEKFLSANFLYESPCFVYNISNEPSKK